MTVILIIVIAISVFGFANYYIGLRTYQYLGVYIPFLNNKVYWALFWMIASAFIFGRINTNIMPYFLRNLLNLIGSYWMAVMLYSIMLFIFVDFSLLIVKVAGFKELPIFRTSQFNFYIGISILAIIASTLIFGTFYARDIKVASYDIRISKKADAVSKLHIVMFSDTHLGAINNNSQLQFIVDKVNNLKPDIILIGGDIIDDNIEEYNKQGMAETFKKLNAKHGVYCVLGNHDGLGSNVEEVVKAFEKGGIEVLRDEYIKVDDSFYVVGREFGSMRRSGEGRKPLEEILAGADKALPVILLDHSPSEFIEAQQQNVDLQLSGHTHAGQLFPSNLLTKSMYEMHWGYLKRGDSQLIVSSGAATWGPPMRIGTDSEILDIKVDFEEQETK